MLDISFIREHLEDVQHAARAKKNDINLDALLSLDDKRKSLQQTIDKLKSQQNLAGKSGKIDEAKTIKESISSFLWEYEEVMSEYNALMLRVPQILHPDVPLGKNDTENIEIAQRWVVPSFDFPLQDHISLMEKNDMIDIERGVKMAWSRSYILKWDGALLEQAVLQYVYKKMISKWLTPLQVPYMVDEKCFMGTWFFPGGEEDAYQIERDDKRLIATAEIPLTSYYRDEILDYNDLPKTFVGMSPCFRREAGTYGKDTRGLYRVHQFNKIEQVVILSADIDLAMERYERIRLNAEEILQDLEIPYRLLAICSGDLSLWKHISHDIECWMPSSESYGETHSVSLLLDFQARRLNIRYRDDQGNLQYCYTMNNTAIALPRFLIPLIENYQNSDGSIRIPRVLQDYMGKQTIKNF